MSTDSVGPIGATHDEIPISHHAHPSGADLVIRATSGDLADLDAQGTIEINGAYVGPDAREIVAGIGHDEIPIGEDRDRGPKGTAARWPHKVELGCRGPTGKGKDERGKTPEESGESRGLNHGQ
jgi:hypothetical protein